MNTKFSSLNGGNCNPDDVPPVGKEVTIIHQGRQRIAYRDSEGHWRDFYDGNILHGEVRLITAD